VLILLAELGEERAEIFRLRDDVDRSQQVFDLDLANPAVVQRGEEVADVQDADDLVE